MKNFEYMLVFAGLSNGGGPGDVDKLFAIGGAVIPVEGSGSAAALGARCPFQGQSIPS